MSKEQRNLALVLAVAGLMFFLDLGGTQLWDEDEPKNASCGREMFLAGNWIVPMFNSELRPDKPIMLYWLMMASYSVFGLNEFAARFPSALLSMGTILLVYQLGCLLYRPRVGVIAAIALASSLMFNVLARASTPDGTLIFFITLALYGYVWGVSRSHGGHFPADATHESEGWSAWAPTSWSSWFIMYGAMGCAVLTKGPVGVLLPSCIIGVFLFLVHMPTTAATQDGTTGDNQSFLSKLFFVIRWYLKPANYIKTLSTVRAYTGLLFVIAIALPWYVLVGIETNGAWLQGFLGGHNVGRFLKPMEGHRGSFLYHPIVLMLAFFPASIFLPKALVDTVRGIFRKSEFWKSHAFLVSWIGIYLFFFSVAATKLPNYVAPCYPALALVTAFYLDRCCSALNVSEQWWFRLGLRFTAVAGIGIAVGLTLVSILKMPQPELIGLVGIVLVAGAGISLSFAQRKMSHAAVGSFVGSSALFTLLAMTVAAGQINDYQDGPRIVQVVREISDAPFQTPLNIGAFGYFAPTFVYYGRGRVARLNTPGDVATMLQDSQDAYIVLPEDRLVELEGQLPHDVHVLHTQQRFLRDKKVVVLGRTFGESWQAETVNRARR